MSAGLLPNVLVKNRKNRPVTTRNASKSFKIHYFTVMRELKNDPDTDICIVIVNDTVCFWYPWGS